MPMRNAYEPVMEGLPPPPMPMPTYNEYGQVGLEPNLDHILSNLEFDNFERQTQNYAMPRENVMMLPSPDGFGYLNRAALEQRAFEIRDRLTYTTATLNPGHPPSKQLLDTIELISATNIASWIELYFRHWHKHGPMVHEASFNPSTAALPLVLALMSLGGMVSASHCLVLR